MNFTLTILGSGAALPTARRKPTSQYVVCNDRHVLIDCGEGTQTQCRKYGVKLQRIDIILISHLHGDHFFGLIGLLSSMHLLGRDKKLIIYGPKGLEEIIQLQLKLSGTRLNYEVEFIETNAKLNEVVYEDNKLIIYSIPLNHRIATTGFLIREKPRERKLLVELAKEDRVPIACYQTLKSGKDAVDEDGKCYSFETYTLPGSKPRAYAYCSDTAYLESVVEYVKEVDLLYHEATFLSTELERATKTFHSTAEQAAQIAKKAQVKHLIIGHLSARYDDGEAHLAEARAYFESVEVAYDGMQVQVGPLY